MTDVKFSIEEKIGQLFMVGFPGKKLNREVRQFIHRSNLGFIILFSRNIDSIARVVELTNELHSLSHISPFIFTDQEGGTVVQFKQMASTVVSHMGLAATGKTENARLAAKIIGTEMEACGFDGVLAPVLDVNFEEKNPIIGIRSFSDRPEVVIKFASKFYQGLQESGVAGCGKHFPGHGGTVQDSHLNIPVVNLSEDVFYACCVEPFSALVQRNIDAIMTSHVRFQNISDQIATFSPFLVTRLLRKKFRFGGVIISDCLEMRAVRDHFTAEEIIKKAMEAGVDIITSSHSLDFQKELYETLIFNIKRGRIPERRIDESLVRILALKNKYHLLGKRKIKDFRLAERTIKSHRKQEQKLADDSVTMLRNQLGVIPIGEDKKILIIEWQKVKATMSFSQAEDVFMLWRGAKKFYKNIQCHLLKLDGTVPRKLMDRLVEYDYIIAGLYSRNPDIEKVQAAALNQIEKIRKDVIVVALGNPYDIRHIKQISTYIVTYGFRDIQIDAFFKLVRGDLKPSGKLPVLIQNVCPGCYEIE